MGTQPGPAAFHGISFPRVLLGTARLGARDPGDAYRRLDDLFDAGCRAFDTAAAYCRGQSDVVLGQWLERRGVADQVFILGKGGHPDQSDTSRLDSQSVNEDLQRTLERLKRPKLDLYVLHRDDPDLPVGPIVENMERQRCAGLFERWGVSNWQLPRLEAAIDHAHANGLSTPAGVSQQFSLLAPRVEPWPGCVSVSGTSPDAVAFRAWLARTGMPLLAWSPFASGWLSAHEKAASRLSGRASEVYETRHNRARLSVARQLAQTMGVTTGQVVIAYMFSQGLNLSAIVDTSSRRHFEEVSRASAIRLSDEELHRLACEDISE